MASTGLHWLGQQRGGPPQVADPARQVHKANTEVTVEDTVAVKFQPPRSSARPATSRRHNVQQVDVEVHVEQQQDPISMEVLWVDGGLKMSLGSPFAKMTIEDTMTFAYVYIHVCTHAVSPILCSCFCFVSLMLRINTHTHICMFL